jgi:hypothetical protein
VCYSHHNEQYFQQAVRYLRTAASIEGFTLSSYLQRYALSVSHDDLVRCADQLLDSYLEDFGRLVS